MLRTSLVLTLSAAAVCDYVDRHTNCNQVDYAVPNPGQSTEWVRYLGTFDDTDACIDACTTASNATDRCHSYTYHEKSFPGAFATHCYGRFGDVHGSVWFPVPQQNVNCGRIIYPCKDDSYCQLNGKCVSGQCQCDPQWKGPTCQELRLLPATKYTGYNRSDHQTSSWGGAVLIDHTNNNNDTKYHMYLSEMDDSCGLNSWVSNSVLTHAQSTKGYNSNYEKVEVIRGHFSHEPTAMYGPKGEHAMFYSAVNATYPECNCTGSDGSTPPTCSGPAEQIHFQEVLAYSDNGPKGPWHTCIVFQDRSKHPVLSLTDDTNLAGVVLPNGSFVGLLRHWNPSYGSEIHSVTATNWKDCDSYQINAPLLFPQLPMAGAEDPHVYQDCKGRFHAIFHNKSPGNADSLVGGHAHSSDGVTWIFSGVIYGNVVNFTDGSSFAYSRRERPHFILADDGCTPLALTTGVVYGGKYGDASFTHLQPISQH